MEFRKKALNITEKQFKQAQFIFAGVDKFGIFPEPQLRREAVEGIL